MSKRRGSSINRHSKRHKSNDYNDGKTELQREMEYFEQHEQQQAQDELFQAQQELQRQQLASNMNNNNNYSTNNNHQSSGIVMGTPITDDDDDDDIDDDDDYQENGRNNNNIRDDSDISDCDEGIRNDRDDDDSMDDDDINKNSMNNMKESEITLHDLRSAQMKRSALERICTEPYFSDFIGRSEVNGRMLPGLFCRIYIGDRKTSSGSTESIYRICEMIDIEDYRRSYLLTDKRTLVNIGLLIAHGSNRRLFKIIQTSNSPFTEKEFIQWKQTMIDDGLQLPTKDELSESYLNAIKNHKNFKYDRHQIAIMREKKNKHFNASTLANPHKEKLRISTIVSGLNENDQERHRYILYLNDINREIEKRNSNASQSVTVSIASINEKNKIKNKKLMFLAREKERKLHLKMKGKQQIQDPFTRAITAPQIESFGNIITTTKEEEKKEKKEKEEDKKLKKEEEEEDINKLSILKYGQYINNNKQNEQQEEEENNKQCVLIKNDKLWISAIHCVAKEFINKCQNINIIQQNNNNNNKQPQFGRNTNKSKYGNKFTKKPNQNLQIISIDEYLKTKKYSAM